MSTIEPNAAGGSAVDAAVVPSPPVAPAAAVIPRSKKQITASALADGVKVRAKWKTLIAEARTVWAKLHPEELAKVNGDFHRLAGLVQLRYEIGRAESDRQVRAFFDKHYAPV